jgi:Na+-transporting methylmalonyl-CoA/oxaloacetate decarboxylase gamma subunit
MYLVPIAWMYVVGMVVLAEALSVNGTVLGALFTLVFWGLLPLAVVMYVLGTPARRRARQAASDAAAVAAPSAAAAPDGGGMTAGDAVAAERKEP